MVKVLVTGAHGFLGRYVAQHFSEKGFEVTGIGHGSWTDNEYEDWGISSWHSCDITQKNLEKYSGAPDAIVHCAGSSSVGASVKSPESDFQKSVLVLFNLLEFIRKNQIKCRIVYPSSAAVYGKAINFPINENSELNPISFYGVNKVLSEQLCLFYSKNYSIPITIIRFFSLYGRHLKKQLLWDACLKISENSLNFSGTGNEIRDWLHVSDAASLIKFGFDNASIAPQIVNGGSGKGASVRTIIEELLQQFGKKNNIIHFSNQSRNGDPDAYIADISKSIKWGWCPKTGLKDGIKDYVQWFKKGAN